MYLKISVIVPIYNAEKFLIKCLTSISKQKYQNIEVILINDGSTDNSLSICEKFISSNSNWILINQSNSGSQAARRNGLLQATGDYITFIDADDYIEENYFFDVSSKLEKNSPDILCVAATYETEKKTYKIVENNIKSSFYDSTQLNTILKKAIYFDNKYYEFGIIPSNWSKFFKRDIANIGFPKVDFKLKMGEDEVCTLACISSCNNLEICNEIFGYHYVFNEKSIVHSFDSLYFDRLLHLKENLNYIITEGKYKDCLLPQLPYYYTFLIEIGINSFHLSKNPFKIILNLNKIRILFKIIKNHKILDYDINLLQNLPPKTINILRFLKNKKIFLLCLKYLI